MLPLHIDNPFKVLGFILNAGDILDDRIGPVDGDVGELEEIAQGDVASEVVLAPGVQVLGGRRGVSLGVQFIRIHAAQENDGAGILDIVDGVVDEQGGRFRIGFRRVEILVRIEAVGFLLERAAGKEQCCENEC